MQQKTCGVGYFLLIALSFSSFSCSGVSTPGPEEPPEKPHARVTLRVSCPDEFSHTLIAEVSNGWIHRGGLRPLEPIDVAEGIPDERADLWVLPACTLPRWASADRLNPLPDELLTRGGRFRWSGLLPIYREQLLSWQGRSFAVPLLGDAPLCFYRKDLFADPRHQEDFQRQTQRKLEPPATWDDFAAIAEYFREARQRQPSLTNLPAHDEELDRLFYIVAASTARRMLDSEDEEGKNASDDDLFAFHFDLKTGKPLVSGPGFVSALKLLQRLQACRPPKSDAVPWNSFFEGRAVLCLGDARLIGAFQAAGSPIRDKVGICRVPGSRVFYSPHTGEKQTMSEGRVNRVPYLGAGVYLLAVPRSSRQSAVAFELLAEIGGREMAQQIVLDSRWGGGATRLEHLDQRFDSWRLPPDEADRTRTVLRETIQSSVRNPLVCLRLPREHLFRAVLTARLRSALLVGQASTDEGAASVLQAIARKWETLIESQPADHLRDYRWSLGLTR